MKIFTRFSGLFLTALLAMFLGFVGTARAVAPTLSLSTNSDNDSVQVTVNGDANSSVIFYYTKTNVGAQILSLGTTNASGYFSASVSTLTYGIASSSQVYVTTGALNGTRSNTLNWPASATSGNFYLSPTSVALTVGQSSTVIAYNAGSSYVYLSNNSNPPVANINISGNQIGITALSYGSTVANVCLQNNNTTCASVYITVQSGSVQPLTFSISNVTVTPGQSVPITISGGTGVYTILNNTNSSVIQAGISEKTITLTAAATSGSAAITVCSSDMGSCGIINATASSASTTPLVFSQTNPAISIGQTATIGLSGGSSSTYYISANSNSTAVTANISGGNALSLTGLVNGTATITVCSSAGSCGSLVVTVSYTSSGGSLQLSQSTVSLLAGQILSITISGGTTPYSLSSNNGNIAQASLNGNIITLSGISAGSAPMNVCSAGGACIPLTVIVNSSGAGVPITFSQSSVSLNIGGTSAVTIAGSGGYYVSNSSNSSVASVQISGNVATVSGLVAGNTNVSVCQSGGQCAIMSISVSSGSANTAVPVLGQSAPTLAVGQVKTITVSGGTGSNYYVAANSSPNVVSLSLSGNTLTVTGLAQGSSSVVVCAASNSCTVMTATVGATAAAAVTFTTSSLPSGTVGQAYNSQLQATGGSGSLTYSVVSGSLPAGLLLLTNNGSISGTPTAAGTSAFTVKASDASGNNITANFSLIINSASAPATNTNTGTYVNGQLINENGTIYMVYKNTKSGFANAAAFLGLGFNFKNIVAVSNSGLALSGKTVVTASGAHPRGTWVLSGKAVYFVTPEGLIPVPTWDVFLSNGGKVEFLVKATSYDLRMAKLSVMGANDSRLK